MISSPNASLSSSSKSAASDLLDQTALSALAQRLVEAAERAGADAADAVAVRGVSQGVEVRDGRSRKSSDPKATMLVCACSSDERQAVVSTNDISGDNVAHSQSALWRWRRLRLTMSLLALPILRCWRNSFQISICSIRRCHLSRCLSNVHRRRKPRVLQ